MNDILINLPIGLTATATIISALVLIKKQQLKKLKQRQSEGLVRLQALRELLSHVQKHRGLSSGYLHGDYSLLDTIQQLQSTVVRDIHSIAKIAGNIETDDHWNNITQHWARLSANFSKNTTENNLDQHNKLIQSILYLIEETADRHDLLKLETEEIKALRFVWKELLTAAECIGQARAIGTGVAAAGECDNVSRVRLSLLQQKIEETSSLAWTGIPASDNQKNQLHALLRCIEERLLNKTPNISANDYFLQCTAVMDTLYSQYDRAIINLRQH